jgi:hypothetical protein
MGLCGIYIIYRAQVAAYKSTYWLVVTHAHNVYSIQCSMFYTARSVFLNKAPHDLLVREADYLVLPHGILHSVWGF